MIPKNKTDFNYERVRLQLFSKCIPKHNGYDKEMSLWHLKNDIGILAAMSNVKEKYSCGTMYLTLLWLRVKLSNLT